MIESFISYFPLTKHATPRLLKTVVKRDPVPLVKRRDTRVKFLKIRKAELQTPG
jgi:hypothetical protein